MLGPVFTIATVQVEDGLTPFWSRVSFLALLETLGGNGSHNKSCLDSPSYPFRPRLRFTSIAVNVKPDEVARIVTALRAQDLWEHILVEVSGRISEAAMEAYAASAVDAISVGALTHSCRALDFRASVEPRPE